MPRKSKLADAKFVARIHTELAKPGATMATVAKRMKVSPVTVYRATGGRARVLNGTASKWVEKAKAVANDRRKLNNRKSAAKRQKAAARKARGNRWSTKVQPKRATA